jgi:hypothetical protein
MDPQTTVLPIVQIYRIVGVPILQNHPCLPRENRFSVWIRVAMGFGPLWISKQRSILCEITTRRFTWTDLMQYFTIGIHFVLHVFSVIA